MVWEYRVSWTFLVLFPFFFIHGYSEILCGKKKHVFSLFGFLEFWVGFKQIGLYKQIGGTAVGHWHPSASVCPNLSALSFARALQINEVLGGRQMGVGLSADPEGPQTCPQSLDTMREGSAYFAAPTFLTWLGSVCLL